MLVLASAIYFQGAWASPFDPARTREADFFLATGETVKVPMMSQDQVFRTGAGPGLRLMELPFQSGATSLVVLLPDSAKGISAVEKKLSLQALEKWLSGLKPERLHLSLPRFKLHSDLYLGPALQALGMKRVFTPAADLSGLARAPNLFLALAVHSAAFEVNEQGAVAGAVTALGAVKDGNPEFTVDHPFLYLLRDQKTGAIIFLGRVMDPRG
jgi:serpin B